MSVVLAPGRGFLELVTGEALNEYVASRTWPEHAQRRVQFW